MSHIYPDGVPIPSRPITLDEALKMANDTMERAERGRAESSELLDAIEQLRDSGTTDRQTIALESIARSLEKMARPPVEISTIPTAGSLAEVAQRLVDAVTAAMHDDGSSLRPSIMDSLFGGLNAAAALGIVPGGKP